MKCLFYAITRTAPRSGKIKFRLCFIIQITEVSTVFVYINLLIFLLVSCLVSCLVSAKADVMKRVD